MTGQLSITDTNTSTETVENWSIYLDEATWEVQSNKTIILSPSNYDFSLLITSEDGTQQYVGSANADISDGTNDIALTIRPVIGDTIENVNIVANLADFRFQYIASELSGLTSPKIGIQIDDGTEKIFDISPDSGKSESYVNITEGSHKMILKSLFEARSLYSKSYS